MDVATDAVVVRRRRNDRRRRRRLVAAGSEADDHVGGGQQRRAGGHAGRPVAERHVIDAGPWRQRHLAVTGHCSTYRAVRSTVRRRYFNHVVVVTCQYSVAPCNRQTLARLQVKVKEPLLV